MVEAETCVLDDDLALSDISDNEDMLATGEIIDDVDSTFIDTNKEDLVSKVPENNLPETPKKITDNNSLNEWMTGLKEGPQLKRGYKIPKNDQRND